MFETVQNSVQNKWWRVSRRDVYLVTCVATGQIDHGDLSICFRELSLVAGPGSPRRVAAAASMLANAVCCLLSKDQFHFKQHCRP